MDPKRSQKLEEPLQPGPSRQELPSLPPGTLPSGPSRQELPSLPLGPPRQELPSPHREKHQPKEVAKRTSSDRMKQNLRGSHETKDAAKEPPKRATKPQMQVHEETPHQMDEQTPHQMGKSESDHG